MRREWKLKRADCEDMLVFCSAAEVRKTLPSWTCPTALAIQMKK